jgi:hypothetical protein
VRYLFVVRGDHPYGLGRLRGGALWVVVVTDTEFVMISAGSGRSVKLDQVASRTPRRVLAPEGKHFAKGDLGTGHPLFVGRTAFDEIRA